jgi:serine/threonine protein kinase
MEQVSLKDRLRLNFDFIREDGGQDQTAKVSTRKSATSESPEQVGISNSSEIGYTAKRIIGYGNTSIVFEAVCDQTGDLVAIKKTMASPDKCQKEAEMLSRFKHPNIVKLKACFFNKCPSSTKTMFFNIVMDKYDTDLSHMILTFKQQKQQLPKLLIKLYAYQMIKALAYLEAMGIIHADVCTSNFLLNYNQQTVVLCDFGESDIEKTTVAKNSLKKFKSPEQLLLGSKATHKTDIWSLGCSIAELVIQEPLFTGKSTKDILSQMFELLGFPKSKELSQKADKIVDPYAERSHDSNLKKVECLII